MDKLKNSKFNRGITLVALVVTIVVLLILAGVSINLVLGENGLISQAQEAREKTKQAEKNETEEISNTSDFITQTVVNLPRTDETKPYAPSSEFSVVEGTNLANGLVIEDSDGNQYVWVEVPMTTTVYPTTGLNVTQFNTETYKKIEEDLHQYTMSYRKGKSDTETTYKDEYVENSDAKENWFNGENEYNEQKYKMLKSVYQNGGFYVGRYEAGIKQNRTSKVEINEVPESKENLYPYTYITRAQAKVLAEKVQYGEYTGSLMFGVQWDLMLADIHKKCNIDNNILNNDSTAIGNYYDATYTINRGKYAKFGENGNEWRKNTDSLNDIVNNKIKLVSTQSNSILLTTGAVERNKTMNIYDIAGNVWEWTLEYAISGYPCASRGGHCDSSGSEAASYRIGSISNYSNEYVGFRVSIY